MKNLFSIFLFFLFAISIYSQDVVWDFEGENTVGTVPAGIGVTADNLVIEGVDSVGYIDGYNSDDGLQTKSWPSSYNSGDYIKVCITAGTYDKVISDFSFDEITADGGPGNGNKGPQNFQVKYSIGSNENDVESNGTTNYSWYNHQYGSLGIDLPSGSTLCFKIYGYGAGSTGKGTWAFDNIKITISGTQGINLIDFNAKKAKDNVNITWTTSIEINNDYFSLEWSRDGRNFKEIAKIDGAGTSREEQKYSYSHTNPALGTNYYRLTQYDLDGRSETFDVVSVYFDGDKQDMIIAPNKVDNNLKIEFVQPVENGSLLIYNMEGQLIKNSILAKGIDMINLDVSGLASGQYIVKYIDKTGAATKKFVKM